MKESKCEREAGPKHPYIVVMGVTAAGKTTFAEFLAGRINGKFFPELPVEDNPFFKNYYGNPDDYFPVQIFFLDANWRQIMGSKELKTPGIKEILVKEPVVQEPGIFEEALYAQARLEEDSVQWGRYQSYYNGLTNVKSFVKPDLTVFLHLRLPVMLDRIKRRATDNPERASELKESEAYWERLRWLHENWVKENPLGLKIITLDMDRFNFSSYNSDGEALEAAYQELKNRSGGLIK